MAFVFCDDRWRNNKDTEIPGPGEYLISNENHSPKYEHVKNMNYQLMQTVKRKQSKKRVQANYKDLGASISSEKPQENIGQASSKKKSMGKRKTNVHHSNSQSLSKPDMQKVDFTLCIKNSIKSGSRSYVKNKWGNMKLKELLKQMSKTTEDAKQFQKLTNQLSMNHFHKQKKEQYACQRKQLENHFNQARKGTNFKVNKQHKHVQKENRLEIVNIQRIDKKERLLQRKSVNLTIEPNFAYRTEVYTPTNSRPLTSCKSSQSSFQNHIIYRHESIKTNEPTGLEDNSFDEDSIQYIQDATPGPGAYNLATNTLNKKNQTKIEKFGVTIQRFKSQKRLRLEAQTSINPIYPHFKKESKANQQEVGFGKSVKQQTNIYNDQTNAFYEDYNSLQHKSRKLLHKNRGQNIYFESNKQRFKLDKKEMKIEDVILKSYEEEINVQKLEESEQNEKIERPMNIFLSNVSRDLNYPRQISNANYYGQNYNCIASKIKKQIDHLQEFDLKPASFLTKSKRFNYNDEQQQQNAQSVKNELRLIKVAEIKKKKEFEHKKMEKGYTFTKNQTQKQLMNAQMTPSPDKYNYESPWIKSSYNIKFKGHD